MGVLKCYNISVGLLLIKFNFMFEQILLIVAGVLFLGTISAYNSLVKYRNRTKEAWADIDVQLKRRYDLIPNLIETVKGYAKHEKDVFDNVAMARAKAMGVSDLGKKQEAAYPELKASENFSKLQEELRDTEDKIQAARRFYNTNVRDLNTKIESFPVNVIAPTLRFKKMDFFELAEADQREVPKVNI